MLIALIRSVMTRIVLPKYMDVAVRSPVNDELLYRTRTLLEL